jgi:UDP-3-O-[3-hydroxymyristoyl] glucosamine N-acyltransferase
MHLADGAPIPPRMACFGTSGTCDQVALDLAFQARGLSTLSAYVSDADPRSHHDDGLPIVTLEQLAGWGDVGVFVPIHDPAGRRAVFARIVAAGLPLIGARGLPHLVHPSAELDEGAIVTCTTRLGSRTHLGRGTVVLSDIVAHDSSVGEFSTLAVNSVVLGHVQIGRDVFIGAGAVIKNGTAAKPLRIGDGATVGIGAVVDRHVAPGETVVSPRAVSIAEWESMRRVARRAQDPAAGTP